MNKTASPIIEGVICVRFWRLNLPPSGKAMLKLKPSNVKLAESRNNSVSKRTRRTPSLYWNPIFGIESGPIDFLYGAMEELEELPPAAFDCELGLVTDSNPGMSLKRGSGSIPKQGLCPRILR